MSNPPGFVTLSANLDRPHPIMALQFDHFFPSSQEFDRLASAAYARSSKDFQNPDDWDAICFHLEAIANLRKNTAK